MDFKSRMLAYKESIIADIYIIKQSMMYDDEDV